MKAFCDTNVLVYAYSITEPIKAEQANRALFTQLEWLHYIVQGLVKIVRVMRGVKWHKESMIRS